MSGNLLLLLLGNEGIRHPPSSPHLTRFNLHHPSAGIQNQGQNPALVALLSLQSSAVLPCVSQSAFVSRDFRLMSHGTMKSSFAVFTPFPESEERFAKLVAGRLGLIEFYGMIPILCY